MATEDDAARRAMNDRIAEAYDHVPYDPPPHPPVDPARILGHAAIYGYGPAAERPVDVLDLTCGTGAHLCHWATCVGGRLVGVDLSESACVTARARCAGFGERVVVHHRDVCGVQPEELGRFDLIYLIGCVYIVPAPVRQQLWDLAMACLRPGGVIVASYYAGLKPSIRQGIYEVLRAADDPRQRAEARVKAARALLEMLATLVPKNAPHKAAFASAVRSVQRLDDAVLFHEALGPVFEVQSTNAIARSLAAGGVDFLDYLAPNAFGTMTSSSIRALAADASDLAGGAYRFALFARREGPSTMSVATDRVVWHAAARDSGEPPEPDGAVAFRDDDAGTHVVVSTPATIEVMRVLAEGPLPWTEAWARVTERLAARGAPPDDADARTVVQDMARLWRLRAVAPLWRWAL